jgi:hypothetical protein
MRSRVLDLLIASSLLAVPARAQVDAFFAPPEQTGSLTVRLYPMENVTAGSSRLVTFGVPFTRGSITTAGLAKLRVLKGAVEVPAYVEALTPWRHATNPAHDGTSVRVARVQIQYSFTTLYPGFETITVEWGVTDRTQSLPSLQNPRTGWHTVTSGTFVAADGVQEPDVFAVFPKTHLTKGSLRPMRMSPFDDSVVEARDNPAVMDATEHWPGQVELDHAHKNNFYTHINEDSPGLPAGVLCPYKDPASAGEPWLFDRASNMFVLYMRSGYLKPLREAVRAAEFYRLKLYPPGTTPASAVGCFSLKNPSPGGYIGSNGTMYVYGESLAYLHWLTGDPQAAAALPWTVSCHEANGDGAIQWSPGAGSWTERHNAIRLGTNTVYWEVTGDSAARTRIQTMAGHFIWHQDGAGGQIPANRLDGALYHYGSQHGDGTANALVASSWMSVLLNDSMVRLYAFTEDPAIARFVKRLGQWQKAALTFGPDHQYDNAPGDLWYPRYMVALDGTPDPADGDPVDEHSLEVAVNIAWGDYFGRLLGEPDATLTPRTADLYLTYDYGVNFWTRPAAPPVNTAFRISPWRKWNWEHRPAGHLSWLMAQNKRALKGDVDQDLKTDLYFRNVTNGQNKVWTMNGTTRLVETAISPNPASPAWRISVVDYFDADGKNDLAFWNTTTGAVEFWIMNGTTRVGAPVPISNAPTLAPSWKLSATADFNRDNRPDLLWRDFATQKMQVWLMNGTARVATIYPSPDQAVHSNWEIVGAFDQNNDGGTDLLWYNSTSGKIVQWNLDGNLMRITGLFTNPANAGDNNWQVTAGGDYGLGPSQTGTPVPGSKDIVWRNATSGNIVVWHMDFAGNRTAGLFTTPQAPTNPLDWIVTGPR